MTHGKSLPVTFVGYYLNGKGSLELVKGSLSCAYYINRSSSLSSGMSF